MWEKTVVHSGLKAYRLVRATSQAEVDLKAALQLAAWEDRWQRKLLADQARDVRARRLEVRSLSTQEATTAKLLALEETKALEAERDSLLKILVAALDRNPSLDWEQKKDKSKFGVPKPVCLSPLTVPLLPNKREARFNPPTIEPSLGLLDKLISSRRARILNDASEKNDLAREAATRLFESAEQAWKAECQRIARANSQREAAHETAMRDWEAAREAFNLSQQKQNANVDLERSQYLEGAEAALLSYVAEVLGQSEYPDSFPSEQRLQYSSSTRTLALDFELPNQTVLPETKEVKYVATRSEFQKLPISDLWIKKVYDELLYQIALRTMFELFQSDEANMLVSVVFNGWVRSIDRATGVEVHACVMSMEARKDEFLAINLRHVEPKACFKKLKGVSASRLIELSPIKPLITVSKEDSRFVDGYDVADTLDDRTNLAAMDWQDFENLIRELFGKEFSKGGGEVKITQASRDGGVDAIAFDPDPIRGGKVVIQAKRYTNTVGVSAVRDLYGTVHNEGANKGILVTTSDFGPDAYAFAKDKPITLLSGGELLYLLAQHGHSAKIDLAEAKRIAAEQA